MGSGLLLDVAAGCGFDGLVLAAAHGLGRSNLLAGVALQPLGPVGPPAAGVFAGLVEPGVGLLRERGAARDPVAAFLLGRWVDHARDVPGRTEHETFLALEHL